jgi:GNAT superfamily N-acetyltransferase
MPAHELVNPMNENEWRAYHEIRRQVLFEARGQFAVYNENHPDDQAPGHYPKLLKYDGEPVGVVRIDIHGAVATLRRVAIRAEVQKRGHGRALLSLAQRVAEEAGCTRLESFVAPDAIGFYRRAGFEISDSESAAPPHSQSVFMSKDLSTRAG